MKTEPRFSAADADLRGLAWRSDSDGYAVTAQATKAHRVVLARRLRRPLTRADICDHINGDRLDNRRSNLRLTDALGNAQNRRAHRGSTSGARGVDWYARCGKWQARVMCRGRRYYLGLFDSVEEAAKAAAAKRAALGFLGARKRGPA